MVVPVVVGIIAPEDVDSAIVVSPPVVVLVMTEVDPAPSLSIGTTCGVQARITVHASRRKPVILLVADLKPRAASLSCLDDRRGLDRVAPDLTPRAAASLSCLDSRRGADRVVAGFTPCTASSAP
ncbi:hypothetical protein [Nannocystis bainbridge]|uniref:Uncharacterized protein n=1 Tax=Nannocystis bainbridge TaxID=2995303 RepID=A0ABT5DUD8_9BACT|nr:hypothetical protein [Nannocystis bainbridge]MDC0716765.1 hypothetical protein [Nannocystis bainbridge]